MATKYELTSILSDCEPTVLLVSQKFIDTAKALQEHIPSIKNIHPHSELDRNVNWYVYSKEL